MRYSVTIDGTDILATYGVFVGRGGFNEVVQWPALKEVKGNDWQEQNGFEPDLSDIHLSGSEAEIVFNCRGGLDALDTFWAFLAGKPVRHYSFNGLSLNADMRLISMSSLEYAHTFNVIKAKFGIDKPFSDYTYQAPVTGLVGDTGYEIDGDDLGDYGIIITKGTIESLAKKADIKPLLLRDISTKDGRSYDENPALNDPNGTLTTGYESIGNSYEGVSGTWKRSTSTGTVTESSKEIVLKCFMATSVTNFWRNYLALLHDLVKDNESETDITLKGSRTLNASSTGMSYKCFYNSQKITDFVLQGGSTVLAKFEITLTVITENVIEQN